MKKKNLLFVTMTIFTFRLTISSCGDDRFYDEPINDNTSNTQANQNDFVALYEILGDQIIKINDGFDGKNWMHDDVKHQEMWDLIAQLIDAGDRPWITQFMVIDGQGELYGFVEPLNEDLTQWTMGMAIDMAYVNGTLNGDKEYVYTAIHEFAHVLSLNHEQLNPNTTNCNTYNLEEGCAHGNSYINQFFDNFWKDIFNEHRNIDPDDYDAIDAFYEKYDDRFVTDYAATNPAEDIAESFAYFVTKEEKPNGNAIADKKVSFMYDFPEFIDMRDRLRQSTFNLPMAGAWKRPKCKHKKGKRIEMIK